MKPPVKMQYADLRGGLTIFSHGAMYERMTFMSSTSSTHVESRLYTVSDISKILKISARKAYDLCSETKDFKVVRVGRNVRIRKDSFDAWFDGL